ncbi:MAG: acyl-CoA dehydrogenase family protein [Polyangiaceae bacterium]|nr:acyl-CoA dehydrogenase family protein [Polyangiaceae bacterium]
MPSADAVLEHVLTAPAAPAPLDGLESWWRGHLLFAARFWLPIDLAFAAGFAADRPGYAFASGYQAAGATLVAALGPKGASVAAARPLALCATEEGGAAPRAIRTRLVRAPDGALRLDGQKTFVTLGSFAAELLVVASEGERDGRNRLRLVRIPRERAGVVVAPLPEAPFVPEIPHAALVLRAVRVAPEELAPGDGYDRYLKPFRTVEDCAVHAALLGWLVGVGRRSGFGRPLVEGLCASFCAVRTLALADPSAPATHVALGGVLAQAARDIAALDTEWPRAEAVVAGYWQRDRALLAVAGRARAARLEAAWRRLGAPPG